MAFSKPSCSSGMYSGTAIDVVTGSEGDWIGEAGGGARSGSTAPISTSSGGCEGDRCGSGGSVSKSGVTEESRDVFEDE